MAFEARQPDARLRDSVVPYAGYASRAVAPTPRLDELPTIQDAPARAA
jgi:hypothetical protein